MALITELTTRSWDIDWPFNGSLLNLSRTTVIPRPEDLCTPGEEGESVPDVGDLFVNYSSPFNMTYFPPWELGLKISFYILAILMAVIGNCLVLAVIICNRRMHTRTYFYIANLAVSDLMVGVFTMWVHLGTNVTTDYPFGSTICKLFPFFQIMALTASTGCMTVIAGERFFAIVYPVRAKFSKLYKHIIIVTITWVVAILVAMPNLIVRKLMVITWSDREQKWCDEMWPRYKTGPDPSGHAICLYTYPERRVYYTIQVVCMYFVPVVVMAVAYCVIGYTLRHRRPPGNPTDQVLAQQQRTKKKVVRMLYIIFAAFVICWTPQEMIVLLEVHFPHIADNISQEVRYTAIYVAHFNSSLNPILYAGLSDNFRRGMAEITNCRPFHKNKVTPVPTPIPRVDGAAAKVQIHRKYSLSLLEQGQPKLPPIEEDQSDTASFSASLKSICDNQSNSSSGQNVLERAEMQIWDTNIPVESDTGSTYIKLTSSPSRGSASPSSSAEL